MDNKVLIIAGMHRSGTSLIAQWLHQCGINLGDDLMGKGLGNVKGHYEDLDFFEIHKAILINNNLPKSGLCEINNLEINSEQTEIIKKLLVYKNSKQKNWGWKEPRTTLFLNLYEQLLKDKASYLIVYRNITEVVDSLLRREIKTEFSKRKKQGRKQRALSFLFKNRIKKKIINQHQETYIRAWISYNEKIIQHVQSIDEKKVFITNYTDLLKDASNLFNWLEQKSFIFNRTSLEKIFDKKLISTGEKKLPLTNELSERVKNIDDFFRRNSQ